MQIERANTLRNVRKFSWMLPGKITAMKKAITIKAIARLAKPARRKRIPIVLSN
jgi:hypothetical protein